jgi:glycine/D-amino acid oxidase-like deaminating enzyme
VKIAVIGGGLFGATAAIYAARAGHDVTIHDKNSGIMMAASACNQFRLHRGYHYPRSKDTGKECREGRDSFMQEYGRAVITPGKRKHHEQLYAIASEDSLVTASEYLTFLNQQDLPYRIVDHPRPLLIDEDKVDLVVSVLESAIEPALLTQEVAQKLDDHGVKIHLRSPAHLEMRAEYDKIIVAAYANSSSAVRDLGCKSEAFQYETVEKCVVLLPDVYKNEGVVIMDGPFGCVDPYGWQKTHLLSHVEEAIWLRTFGGEPAVPQNVDEYIDAGLILKPKHTRFKRMRDSLAEYLPGVRDAKHVGSLYTVRTVLPNKEATDARPTMVEQLDDSVVRIFSGKLGTCVEAAKQAVALC